MSAETVGFIGLGHMGEGMSRRLLGRGHKLVVWNRSAAKAKALEAKELPFAFVALPPTPYSPAEVRARVRVRVRVRVSRVRVRVRFS